MKKYLLYFAVVLFFACVYQTGTTDGYKKGFADGANDAYSHADDSCKKATP